MIIRIILFLIIIYYHKEIYNFIIKNKSLNLNKINKKIEKFIYNNDFKPILKDLKHYDKNVYIEVKGRLKDINNTYKMRNNMKLKNAYQNIKEQRREILNLVSGLVCKIGLENKTNNSLMRIKNVINEHIENILLDIQEINEKRGYNTDWFEDVEDEVKNYDPDINYNYSIF